MSETTTDNATTDNASKEQPPASNARRESVGDLLRAQRIKEGKEIVTVAGSLRISARYLEALEDGRNDDLPGTTYAVGFVRSYAEYLGLDEDEIVRRFKDQISEDSSQPELTFPKPIPEGGVPGGVLLLGGAVLALLAYGVLYLTADGDEQVAKMIEPVPQSMSEEVNKKEINKKSSTSPQEGSSVLSDDTSASAVLAAKKPEAEPEIKSVEEEPVAEEAVAEEAVAEEPVAEEPVAEEPVAEEAVAEEPVAEEPVAEETVAEETVAEEPAAETPTAADTQVDVSQSVATGEPKPEVPEVVTAPTAKPEFRITVRAKTNSWIQVRDETEDKLLFTRLLRKGDEYNVPNRDGLTLLTGNAGALEILVDGELVPAIGETGDIRRNVQLDPEQLKSGTAVKN